MEPNGVSAFGNRKSSSSERFIGLFSQSQLETGEGGATGAGDELDEDEVFWTGDFSESDHRSNPPSNMARWSHNSMGFRLPVKFGILAALPEDDKKRVPGDRRFLYRQTSLSSASSSMASSPSRMIPAIPKPPQGHFEREYSMSVPSGKFHQSAPMNVPVLSKPAVTGRNRIVYEVENENGDDEMLPPHEIVARGSSRSEMTTSSVLEGVGRTLKGRDLRQVRNAVWRKTGFLD